MSRDRNSERPASEEGQIRLNARSELNAPGRSVAMLVLGHSIAVGFVAASTDQLGAWLRGTEVIPLLADVVAASSVVFSVATVMSGVMLISAYALARLFEGEVSPDFLLGPTVFLTVLAWIAGWTRMPPPGVSLSGAVELLAVMLPSLVAGAAVCVLLRSQGRSGPGRHWISIAIDSVPAVLLAATFATAGVAGSRSVDFSHPLLSSRGQGQLPADRWVAATLVLTAVGALAVMLSRARRWTFLLVRLAAAVVLVVVGSLSARRTVQGLTTGAPLTPNHRAAFEPRRPNVVLIVVDTLRRDFVSLPNAPGRAQTPNIESLARESVVFRNAVSQSPWTLPAMASILSGLSPADHGLTTVVGKLPAGVETVAETLYRHGYRTAAIGHQTFLANPSYGFQRGFELFDFHPKEYVGTPFPGGSNGATILRLVTLPPPLDAGGVADRVIDWLRGKKDGPFFLWVQYLDPHATYSPPREFVPGDIPQEFLKEFVPAFKRTAVRLTSEEPKEEQIRWLTALYAGEVAFVDRSIGKVVSFLKESSVYDDTLIIVTSDHGEQFFEHGSTHHGSSLHAEELAVPLIVKLPRGGGRDVTRRVTTTALTPTILDVVGISPDAMPYSFPALRAPWEGSPGDSTDLPILVGSKIYGEPEIGLYFEHYKYVQATRRPHELLFDLASDPFEHLSLAASLPEVTERARALVRSIGQQRARKQPLSPDAPIRVDEETRKRLRSIGYLGSSRE